MRILFPFILITSSKTTYFLAYTGSKCPYKDTVTQKLVVYPICFHGTTEACTPLLTHAIANMARVTSHGARVPTSSRYASGQSQGKSQNQVRSSKVLRWEVKNSRRKAESGKRSEEIKSRKIFQQGQRAEGGSKT